MGSVAQFQPLLPDATASAPLVERAAGVVAEANRLEPAAGALTGALAPLLRSMNSYYSNEIEGQHARPAEIERALAHQFDADEKQARKQRLALAHIDAEVALETTLPSSRGDLYAPAFVQAIHRELYGRLPVSDRVNDHGAPVTPGAWRESLVTAGRHTWRPSQRTSDRCSRHGTKLTRGCPGSSSRW